MYIVIVLILSSIFIGPVFVRYCLHLKIKRKYKLAILALCTLIALIPVLVQFEFEHLLGQYFNAYYQTLYFIYISIFILFTVTVLRDMLWGIVYAISKILKKSNISSPFSNSSINSVNSITIAFALITSFYSLYEGNKIPDVKIVQIASDKIFREQKIILLSDIHISRISNIKRIEKIIALANKQEPDTVLLLGDMIDDDIEVIEKSVKILSKLRAKDGIYFVTGNHEDYRDSAKSISLFKNMDFKYLEGEGIQVNDQLFVGGIHQLFPPIPQDQLVNLSLIFKESHKSQFKILLSHVPCDFNDNNNSDLETFDLEVAGHTHGGQIFPFHILAYLSNKYLAGLYNMQNNAQIYVSRGCGTWGPQMRLFAPSEITVIKLTNKTHSTKNNK